MKTVTIAIPSLHRPDLTARCIDFIQNQTLPASEWEIVVIENEAQPGSILADPLPRNTRRIELADNEGTTGSINRAVQATDSRYVLLLNNDVELEPDYLQKLTTVLESDPKVGFVTGKLVRSSLRTHLDGAGDAMLMAGAAFRLGHLDQDQGQFDTPMPILSGCGAAVLYRRDAFEEAGALDPDFFAYLDDLDLALRTQLRGFSGFYLPNAVAYHLGSATLGRALHPRVIEYITRNQIWLLAKDYPSRVLVSLAARVAFYQCAWFLFAITRRGAIPYFRGFRAGLCGLGTMRRKRAGLMAKKLITDTQFLQLLRDSERQIYQWYCSQAPGKRSGLLKLYFRIFRAPCGTVA